MVTREMSESVENIENDVTLNAETEAVNVTETVENKSTEETLEVAVENQVEEQEVTAEESQAPQPEDAPAQEPEQTQVEEPVAEEEPAAGNKNLYRFIVRDTGIGISEEYLPHIFESFTREEKTTVNRIQGTGLGLAITAKVVELMGGTISVKSTLGEGSEFTVELELEALEIENEEKDTHNEIADLVGYRVLLVEDNDINAEIAEMILSQYGIEVDLAGNGQIGLERVQQHESGYYAAV